MSSPALPAIREMLRAVAAAPAEIPAGYIAAVRRHIGALEEALERSRSAPTELGNARRTLDALEASMASHRDHLRDLTGRPGYRTLDTVARRVRRPGPVRPAPTVRTSAPQGAPDDPPIAVAVIETRELLTAAAQMFADDPALGPAAERALAELAAITPELTAGQADAAELEKLAARLVVSRVELAKLQHEVDAVRRRINSRLLDFLRLPARARSDKAGKPEMQGDSASAGWPDMAAGASTVVAQLELPAAPAVILEGETLVLAGWAFTAQAPVSRIAVGVDGTPAGPARTGYVRNDVHQRYGIAHTLLSGFEFRLDPAVIHGRRSIDIDVVAETMDGESTVIGSRRVWIARALERRIDIDIATDIATDTDGAPAQPGLVRAVRTSKLLVFTHDLGYGGGQLWLIELLDRMGAGREFPCTVAAPQSGPLAPALRRLGIEVHVSGAIPTDRADAYEGRLAEALSWAAPQGFTNVLVNTFLAFPGADLASRLAIPCIWAIHESWRPGVFWSVAYPPGGIDRQVRQAAMRALAACPAVVFEAEATRALYADATRPGAAIVVRYGVRTLAIRDYTAANEREAARKALGLTDMGRILLVMGTVEPRKWQTGLALAFAQIARAHADTALAFVGAGDTPYVHGLTEYLRLSGLNHQVRVQQVVADSSPWYRACDALVCASDVESMPRSVLEAMAFGLPVASAAVFGLPELITDGETGLLFDGSDLSAAVAGLERLLALSPEALSTIAAAGQRHVFEYHDSAGYADRIRRLMHEGRDDSLARAR